MFIAMCGIPASGKSTLSTKLASKYSIKIYHFDNYPNAFHPEKYKDALYQMWGDITKELQKGNDVICDNVHTTKRKRTDILNAISGIPCKKICVVLTTPLEECLKRNVNRKTRLPDFVLHDMHNKFEPPSLDEGWDEIIIINNDKDIEKLENSIKNILNPL